MKITAKQITITALFLALIIAVQQFKALSQFITGPLVNAILIIATLYIGVFSGIILAVLSPLFALFINPSPLLTMLPPMTPTVMIGNLIIVILVYIFRKKSLITGLALGSILKAGFLWIAANYILIPIFGQSLKEPMKLGLIAAFSYNQLITAAIGAVIAFVVWKTLLIKN